MESCDVLIVGGGPAGSSCAWRLSRAGLDVAVLDKQKFPRDKICGGWITPAVLQELQIDAGHYAQNRVFQPITGFRVSRMGDAEVEVDLEKPVSYGIRRCEFDNYLLKRCGVRLLEGTPLTELKRSGRRWIVNGKIAAAVVVGAGGHFCPVARFLGARLGSETVVAAQEIEVPMDSSQQAGCAIRPEMPELYFCSDFRGYGWCFHKQNVLNVGFGRLGNQNFSKHVARFIDFLTARRKIPSSLPLSFKGHAYLLYGLTPRNLLDDGILLIGDSAGLAYGQSGEGIRPAIESGLLAAETLLAAGGDYSRHNLEAYRTMLRTRFGDADKDWVRKTSRYLPEWFVSSVGRQLLKTRWFSRRVLVERWFLHSHDPALTT